MEILDAHQHLGLIEDYTKATGDARAGESLDEREHRTRVEAMDASGIHHGIIGPAYQYLMPNGAADTSRYNDRIAAFRDRDPRRFPFAIAAIEPRHGQAAVDEVRRVARHRKMAGVMWHHRLQGCYVDSPWTRKCALAAVEEGLVNFVHSHHGSLLEAPWRVERLAAECPDAPFVVLDGLAGFEETELFYDIAKRRSNIYFDTGMWNGGTAKPQAAVKVMGAERLVFGSGLYSYPMGWRRTPTVDAIREAHISDEAKRAIFSGNLYRLLGKKP
ncbi:MAG: amidohydrolase family protein, partial [Chloroflexi bacterium]|nr:amidohydrolase family protein [Chloroflexota bacterium]